MEGGVICGNCDAGGKLIGGIEKLLLLRINEAFWFGDGI